ncbi:MAG: hypothetical protein LBG27_11630 [Spirochaetaceae bacterium]|nr:hypothetical protein [Spirochaetaceae bacterium]
MNTDEDGHLWFNVIDCPRSSVSPWCAMQRCLRLAVILLWLIFSAYSTAGLSRNQAIPLLHLQIFAFLYDFQKNKKFR